MSFALGYSLFWHAINQAAYIIDGMEAMMTDFLPLYQSDQAALGIQQFDFICITGDAYVDHPSFGMVMIARLLQSKGFTVAMIAQPDCSTSRDFTRFGTPKYAFLITSGNIDSMVAHYTVAKRLRSSDAYSPGGLPGKRPDRAVIVYTRKVKQIYPNTPVILGGLEASLRRFAHYDYWDDCVMPSILYDAGADLLVFGMGERQILQIAHRLKQGESINQLTDIDGTCYLCDPIQTPYGTVECPSFDVVSKSKQSYAKSVAKQTREQDEVYGRTIIQRQQDKMLVQNPPMRTLSTSELDALYALPYMRKEHPSYQPLGGVPALIEVQFSIAHNRGCFGGCHFCSIAFHQGRRIASRSAESVVEEARQFTRHPDFKGYIHDVGGPTANFRQPSCNKQIKAGACPDKQCLAPTPCKQLVVDHQDYCQLLREIRAIPGIKRVFIRSGIRYDYLLQDQDETFFNELVTHHVSGQLKVAPEHCSSDVLDHMGKPHIEAYLKFMRKFYQKTNQVGKKQYLVPYLMSSHPGSKLQDAIALALFLKQHQIHPEQVQDFYPTPGTVSTCMYYTGLDPFTLEPVYVATSPQDKAMQRALLQYFQPNNKHLVRKALRMAGRADLIGNSKNALVADVSAAEKRHRKHSNHVKGQYNNKNIKKQNQTHQPRKR